MRLVWCLVSLVSGLPGVSDEPGSVKCPRSWPGRWTPRKAASQEGDCCRIKMSATFTSDLSSSDLFGVHAFQIAQGGLKRNIEKQATTTPQNGKNLVVVALFEIKLSTSDSSGLEGFL